MKKSILILALVFALGLTAGCTGKEKAEEKKIENITREEKEEISNDAPVSEEKEVEPTEEDTKENEVSSQKDEQVKAVSLSLISSEIKNAVSASGALDLNADAIASLYGVDASTIVQAAGFVVMEGTFPHEAVMVELKDAPSADAAEKLLNSKYNAFVQQSKGYDAQNYALASKCRVERCGNYISMFLTPDFEVMKSIYSKYVK